MNKLLEPKLWESKAALLAYLDRFPEKSMLIGRDVEAPQKFYSFSIPIDTRFVEIGIISSGLSIKPEIFLCENKQIVVGCDCQIKCISLQDLSIVCSKQLDGVFYELIPVELNEVVLIVQELGVICINPKGEEIWSIDTDIIEDFWMDHLGNLILTIMEDTYTLKIDILSGKVS